MTRTRNLMLITAAAIVAIAPAPAAHADSFGLYIGSDGFGLSIGTGDWAVWGASWHDPAWSLDYDVALAGYGEWVWVGGLGRVWRPYVAADWRPYTHGRWVYTNVGWTWVSYEPWGYAPHHYGEWALTTFGWTWVPGYTYRPANVVWVTQGDYLGWYPRAPHGWSHAHRGFSSSHARAWNRGFDRGYDRGYGDGYWDGWQDARHATWVPWKQMASDNVARHAIARTSVTRASVYNLKQAPARAEVVRRSGHAVPEVRMSERRVQANQRTMTIARPEGLDQSVRSHAGETVRRALAPSVADRIQSRSAGSSRKGTAQASPVTSPRSGIDRSPPAASTPRRSTPAATASPSRTSSRSQAARPERGEVRAGTARSTGRTTAVVPTKPRVSERESPRSAAPVGVGDRSPVSASPSGRLSTPSRGTGRATVAPRASSSPNRAAGRAAPRARVTDAQAKDRRAGATRGRATVSRSSGSSAASRSSAPRASASERSRRSEASVKEQPRRDRATSSASGSARHERSRRR